MAKRYGCLPSQISELTNEQFSLNLLVASVASQHEAKEQKKANDKAKQGRRR